MSTTFDVSLVVMSRRLSLPELASRLEREPQTGSHDKRDLRRGDAAWGCTIWRGNSQDANAPWCEQCFRLLREMPPKCIELRTADPDDISVGLQVAAFYEAAYFDLTLPHGLMGELSRTGVDIEIVGYPVAEEDA